MRCTQCGAVRPDETSRFCSNCGSALDGHPAAHAVPQSGEASVTVARGRNVVQVLLGALGGFWLGLAFVGALLFFAPREKRADRLFGAWLGTAAGGLALAAIVVAISMSSSSGATTNTSSQPGAQTDRVVGVMRRCTLASHIAGAAGSEHSGDDCVLHESTPAAGNQGYFGRAVAQRYAPQNVTLEVTVRTAAATTYTVEVPPDTPVAVGDAWPLSP